MNLAASRQSKPQSLLVHSSRYRGLSDIASNGVVLQSRKVLVLGGSHSGGEIAASMALGASTNHELRGVEAPLLEIIHATPHPMYAIPSFTQLGKENLTFAPLDFSLYELSN